MDQVQIFFRQLFLFLKWRTKKTTLEDLAEHVQEITNEQTFINYYATIRKQFYTIVEQSVVSGMESEFWPFLHMAFAHELVLRINRLVDQQFGNPDRRVYSLLAMLMEIRRNPELISRKHYVGGLTLEEWAKSHPDAHDREGVIDDYMFSRLNAEYDGFVGAGKICITKKDVDRDIKSLRKTVKNLKAYRNQTLAHNAAIKTKVTVQFGEINDAIDLLNKLIHKYFALIKVGGHSLTLPTPDFTDLFLKPWIAGVTEQKKIFADVESWAEVHQKKIWTF